LGLIPILVLAKTHQHEKSTDPAYYIFSCFTSYDLSSD
jgi:hypothetical protein